MTKKKDTAAKAAPDTGAAKAVKKESTVENATVLRQKAANEARKIAAKAIAEAAKKATDLKDAETSASEKASKKEVKDNRPVFTDERGLKFRFKKSAPKTLNIDGQSRLVSELIEDKEVMLELVSGNSNQIEQIH